MGKGSLTKNHRKAILKACKGSIAMNISEKVFNNIIDGIVEALDSSTLHTNFLYDLVNDVHNFRKVLEDISKTRHACDCPAVDGGIDCFCPVGVAQEALKEDE